VSENPHVPAVILSESQIIRAAVNHKATSLLALASFNVQSVLVVLLRQESPSSLPAERCAGSRCLFFPAVGV
jgi:hypothetical protein